MQRTEKIYKSGSVEDMVYQVSRKNAGGFVLYCFVKSRLFAFTNKRNLRETVNQYSPSHSGDNPRPCEKVTENFLELISLYWMSRGGYLPDRKDNVIFCVFVLK